MRRWIGVGLMFLALPSWADAGEARAQLMVTARVVPRVTLETVAEPARFTVAAADIQRGYLDIGAEYRVSGNDPAGYFLRVAPRVGVTTAIEIDGLASRVVLRDESIDVMQPGALRPQLLRLSLRLRFAPGLMPGTYGLPVYLTAYTLQGI
jgi:hypothetical protein